MKFTLLLATQSIQGFSRFMCLPSKFEWKLVPSPMQSVGYSCPLLPTISSRPILDHSTWGPFGATPGYGSRMYGHLAFKCSWFDQLIHNHRLWSFSRTLNPDRSLRPFFWIVGLPMSTESRLCSLAFRQSVTQFIMDTYGRHISYKSRVILYMQLSQQHRQCHKISPVSVGQGVLGGWHCWCCPGLGVILFPELITNQWGEAQVMYPGS